MDTQTKTKKCRACGKELPRSEFYSNTKSKDGLAIYCKTCHYARQKERLALLKKEAKGLSAYTPRELMQRLSELGYRGKLTYEERIVTTQVRTIDLDRISD